MEKSNPKKIKKGEKKKNTVKGCLYVLHATPNDSADTLLGQNLKVLQLFIRKKQKDVKINNGFILHNLKCC